MAEPDPYTIPQRFVTDLGSPAPQNQAKPRKFYSHSLYRFIFIAILVALLPLFPSQAPEFINQAILMRSWELLHLLLVGIAVSYGLFSRRNIETDKENQLKIDNTQTYVSKILQVSPVFDDEVESPSRSSDENRIQTWNSQYFRGDPTVVVEQDNYGIEFRNDGGSKPLLLPVRSLKSRVSNRGEFGSVKGVDGFSGYSNGSSSVSKGSSSQSPDKNRSSIREIGRLDLDPLNLDEGFKENVVLPSPIPWRSRSGRMEVMDEAEPATPQYYHPSSVSESDSDRIGSQSFRSPVPWSPRPNSSSSPSPKKLSPSPSLSPELRAKNCEEEQKRSFYRPSPPPPPAPPPPPLPPIIHKSPTISMDYSNGGNEFSNEKKTVVSFKDELKDLSRSSRKDSFSNKDLGMDSSLSEKKHKNYIESPSIGRSVRTIRTSESATDPRTEREARGDGMEEKAGKRYKDVEAVVAERHRTKIGSDFSKYQKQKGKFTEKVIVESDDSDRDDDHEGSNTEEAAPNPVVDAIADPNEVDKKADEFIAKFREQIRLQRIASIKRSSGQISSRNRR